MLGTPGFEKPAGKDVYIGGKGQVTSIAAKIPLPLKGDGERTLEELIRGRTQWANSSAPFRVFRNCTIISRESDWYPRSILTGPKRFLICGWRKTNLPIPFQSKTRAACFFW